MAQPRVRPALAPILTVVPRTSGSLRVGTVGSSNSSTPRRQFSYRTFSSRRKRSITEFYQPFRRRGAEGCGKMPSGTVTFSTCIHTNARFYALFERPGRKGRFRVWKRGILLIFKWFRQDLRYIYTYTYIHIYIYRGRLRILRPWGQYFVGTLKISKKNLISGK